MLRSNQALSSPKADAGRNQTEAPDDSERKQTRRRTRTEQSPGRAPQTHSSRKTARPDVQLRSRSPNREANHATTRPVTQLPGPVTQLPGAVAQPRSRSSNRKADRPAARVDHQPAKPPAQPRGESPERESRSPSRKPCTPLPSRSPAGRGASAGQGGRARWAGKVGLAYWYDQHPATRRTWRTRRARHRIRTGVRPSHPGPSRRAAHPRRGQSVREAVTIRTG